MGDIVCGAVAGAGGLFLSLTPVVVGFGKKCFKVRPVVYKRVRTFSPCFAFVLKDTCAEDESVSGVYDLLRCVGSVCVSGIVDRVLDLANQKLEGLVRVPRRGHLLIILDEVGR